MPLTLLAVLPLALVASFSCGPLSALENRIGKDNKAETGNKDQAQTASDAHNLRLIARAMLKYENDKGRYPSAAICNKEGKPLLSWRVAILPYLGQKKLYGRFKLNEPWDSASNRKLLPLMPKTYVLSGKAKNANSMTYYCVFVGDQAPFDKSKGLSIPEVGDGVSDTLLVVEAAEPVPWTKPEDLKYEPDKALPKLGSRGDGSFSAVFMDEHVHFFAKPPDEQRMRALITPAGGEPNDPHY